MAIGPTFRKNMITNDTLQWTGTVCLLGMYVLSSFYPHLYPLNIMAGVAGAVCYLSWTIRVKNKPQMIVNSVALFIGLAGLIRFGISGP
jgi:hypothetical protein